MMKMLFVTYQKNQESIYLKYVVLGKLLLNDPSNATRTNRNVTDPINLLLKFDRLMKRVKYAKSDSSQVGKKIEIIWLV